MKLYPRLLPYGVAIGSTAIALLLTRWQEPLLSRTIGAFFFIAIIISTWYGGFRPGIVAVFLSTLAIEYFLMPSRHQLAINQPENLLRLGIFLIVALTINLLASNLYNSKQKIQQLSQKLTQENAEQLRMALSAAHMGMWDWDILTGEIKWSPEHELLFGLAVGTFDGKYETFASYVHPDDRETVECVVKQALQTHSIYQHEYRIIWADGSIHWVEGRGNAFYNEAGEPVRMTGTIMAIDERKQAQIKLQQQFEQQRLVLEMTQRIRRSLNLQDILQTTVDEVRQFLECDRVTIFQFSPGWGGTVVVESVAPGWMAILPLQIYDPCIGEENVEPFKKGLVTAKADIYNAGISPCHVEFLASLQVRANLVVPIIVGNELWGLLAAHHCAVPREWQSREITLLQQLGEQVSIAIQQAALFEQVQTELRERKRSELALQESEEKLRLFIRYAPTSIVMFDCEMRYIAISRQWAEEFGINSTESVIGRSHYELFPNLPEHLKQSHQSGLAGYIEKCDEDLFVYSDGSQQWFRWELHPWHTGNGDIGGIILFSENITRRKQAQEELRQSEATLRLFAQYAPAGIAMFDRDMRYVMASQRWVDDYHLNSVESLIGRSHYEIFPEIPQRWRQIHQQCLAGVSEKSDEDSFVRLDGSQQWICWEIHPWHTATGEIGGIIIFSDDISERKQAQIALQQLNEELEQRITERTVQLSQINDRLIETIIQQQQTQLVLLEQAQLLDLAHDTIITRDLKGTITFWNEGAEYMYGWTKVEALGQIIHILLKTQFPQPLTQIEVQILEQGYWEGELTHFSRDGRPVMVASRWVLQKDNAGRPIKILEINNDITGRKQAELALKQSEESRRLALDLTHTAFWDLHLPSRDIVWNDNHFTLLGLAPYSVEPSYELWRNAIHPEDVDWVEKRFLESLETRTEYTAEYRVVYPDNSVHWLMGRARAIYDESGQSVRSLGVLLDISDRKLSEAILHQYERIVSTTRDGIALLNRNYIYQIVNQAYLDWCNKPDTEVLRHSVRDVLGEDLFDNFIQPRLDKCLAGETIQYEKWFDYPNLVPQFMSVTYTPYRETDGSISGVIVSLRNLTELKQTEQLLEFQAVITRNMAEGVCLVRASDATIVYANPKFEQMFGYGRGELNGQHVSIVNYASESVTAEDVNQAIRSAVLNKGEATYEVHNVKKDGTPFWCNATCSVFKHPDYGDVLVAVHQDITDRKHIEDALRESEEKFRQLAENIQAVFWMRDIQSQQVIYVSPAYETIWQKSCENVYQNNSDWLDAIHPDDRPLLDIAFTKQLQTGHSDTKYRIIRPDGSMRWIRDRAFLIKNGLEKIVRVAGIAEDITQMQKIEQMKSEFIGIVSHELRTPLTSIRASLGLLQTGVYDKKPDKSKRMIEIAALESERLVRLVNDILDLERLESGRAVLEKRTCNATDLIEQAAAAMQAIAKQQNITFDIHPSDAQVWADADAIIQTLTNLLGNAIKFSPANATITLSVQQQTDFVLFKISDQGRGIPADKIEAIFGRFQQVDASDSRSKGGTGLGLAICRSIIEQHGGKIWVKSTVGVGSTFFFTLPKNREQVTGRENN